MTGLQRYMVPRFQLRALNVFTVSVKQTKQIADIQKSTARIEKKITPFKHFLFISIKDNFLNIFMITIAVFIAIN